MMKKFEHNTAENSPEKIKNENQDEIDEFLQKFVREWCILGVRVNVKKWKWSCE